MTGRQCGDCQLCCRLLPMKAGADARYDPETLRMLMELGVLEKGAQMMRDFDKPASERCPHQRHGKGCTVYAQRPFGCRVWNCRWLVNDDTAELPRPDRSHYVIDVSPDFILAGNGDKMETVPVIQVWLDPHYPDAHKDPKLRAYLQRRGEEGFAALIRLDNKDAWVLIPPALTGAGWVERHTAVGRREHTAAEKFAALGPLRIGLTAQQKTAHSER